MATDALSRPPSPDSAPAVSPPSPWFLSAIELDLSASNFDFSCLPALQSMVSSPSLSIVSVPFFRSYVLCGVSSRSLRPLVPAVLRHQLFLSLHGIFHPGVCASLRLLSLRFVWPGLAKEVSLWTRSCLLCQHSKVQKHVHSPGPNIPIPRSRFSHVHLDLVGPLPSCQGFCYFLTMIDRTSRWLEAVPHSTITTESCARAFIAT